MLAIVGQWCPCTLMASLFMSSWYMSATLSSAIRDGQSSNVVFRATEHRFSSDLIVERNRKKLSSKDCPLSSRHSRSLGGNMRNITADP